VEGASSDRASLLKNIAQMALGYSPMNECLDVYLFLLPGFSEILCSYLFYDQVVQ